MKTSERFYRYSSLTLSTYLLFWYFFGIDLSSIPSMKEIAKLITEKAGEKVIEILTVGLVIFFNLESFLEWSKNKNTNTKADDIRFITTILFSFVSLIIIYNKLVLNTFLNETGRTDLLIPILFGFIISCFALILREFIDIGFTLYKLKKISPPKPLWWRYLALISSIILIAYVFQLITNNKNIISFIFRYSLLVITFIVTFYYLCYIEPLTSSNKQFTEKLIKYFDYRERSAQISTELSADTIEKLEDINKKPGTHKEVMKLIRSNDKKDMENLKVSYKSLADLQLNINNGKLIVEDMTPEQDVLLATFKNSQSLDSVKEYRIKFKYVKLAIDEINKAGTFKHINTFTEIINKDNIESELIKIMNMIGACALNLFMFKEYPKTALFNIVHAGTLVQLKSFVKSNAVDLNCKNDDGYTPLMLAAANGDKDKAEYLLQKGAVPDIPNKFGASPLCYAAMYGKYELCKLLISFGASINHQDTTGTSPLMTASWHGHSSIVKLLLEHNADFNLKDLSGKTALDYAIKNKYGEIAKMLRKKMTS